MPDLELLPWDERGRDLLQAMNTPQQKRHLGGIETPQKLDERHGRYLTYHQPGATEMVMVALAGDIVGSTGYWETAWKGEPCYETGWEVIAAHQGGGIGARASAMLLSRLKPLARHAYVYALPTPDNPGSNGICRKLGFDLIGVEDAEYPKGVWSPHNIWRLDLKRFGAAA